MMTPRRKKWTEAEEKTLIERYGEMVADGTLAKMKTREKKYKPIALYVNSVHHVRDPVTYPWQWTWKDVSTKVQNMRHQYLLVKQKIKKPEFAAMENGAECGNGDEFDWVEGLTHWSNFLRYKDVFGDLPIAYNGNGGSGNDLMGVLNDDRENGGVLLEGGRGMENVDFGQIGNPGDGDFAGIDGGENGVLGLGFDYEGEEAEENYNGNGQVKDDGDDGFMYEEVDPHVSNLRKKRKALKGLEKRVFGFLSNRLGQLREMEARFEQRDAERERERQRRENIFMEREQDREWKIEERAKDKEEWGKALENLRRQKIQEMEAMEKEIEDWERRKQEELIRDREWEERMSMRRSEWKERIDGMLSQHRAEMGQLQTRVLHEQQNLTNHLLGIVSQWTGHPSGLSDHAANNHYLSQMMQNLHHVNGMVHGDGRVDGDAQDDQFIVDG